MTERDHHIHPVTAPCTLVEYGDFECLDSAEGFHVVKELLRDMDEELCYVFRHFPQTEIHPNALLAGEAAEAADLQAKFWLMHDRLFENRAQLDGPLVRRLAQEISLDLHRFDADLESGEPKRRVAHDRAGGARAGVTETPAFFVNGQRHTGAHEFDPLYEALTSTRTDH